MIIKQNVSPAMPTPGFNVNALTITRIKNTRNNIIVVIPTTPMILPIVITLRNEIIFAIIVANKKTNPTTKNITASQLACKFAFLVATLNNQPKAIDVARI